MNKEWENCEHIWRIAPGDWDGGEYYEEVVCRLCGCPGEKDIRNGEVSWPTT